MKHEIVTDIQKGVIIDDVAYSFFDDTWFSLKMDWKTETGRAFATYAVRTNSAGQIYMLHQYDYCVANNVCRERKIKLCKSAWQVYNTLNYILTSNRQVHELEDVMFLGYTPGGGLNFLETLPSKKDFLYAKSASTGETFKNLPGSGHHSDTITLWDSDINESAARWSAYALLFIKEEELPDDARVNRCFER